MGGTHNDPLPPETYLIEEGGLIQITCLFFSCAESDGIKNFQLRVKHLAKPCTGDRREEPQVVH